MSKLSSSVADAGKVNLLNFGDAKIKTLHLTWFAFFLTFVMWFNHAPLLTEIKQALSLTDAQVKALLILNVALTIPARIVVGILVDKFGPRVMYSLLLLISSFFCIGFALAESFETLALFRFLLGFVGAGFVVGIRLVGEWFPSQFFDALHSSQEEMVEMIFDSIFNLLSLSSISMLTFVNFL